MGKTRVRGIDIAVASYVAVGIAMIHMTLCDLFFSVSSGFLVLALLIYERKIIHKFKQYDSWGWSKVATVGGLVGAVIISVGGLPLWRSLLEPNFAEHELLATFSWKVVSVTFFGVLIAVSVYFRGYLEPIQPRITDWRPLEWEHREWLGLFQIAAVFAGIAFVGTGYSYVARLMEGFSPSSPGKIAALMPAMQLLYVVGGYLIWILRPWYGRLKEIRDHLKLLNEAGGIAMSKIKVAKTPQPARKRKVKKGEVSPEGDKNKFEQEEVNET